MLYGRHGRIVVRCGKGSTRRGRFPQDLQVGRVLWALLILTLKGTGMSTTPPGGEGVILEPGKANLRAVFPDGGSLCFFGTMLLELSGL